MLAWAMEKWKTFPSFIEGELGIKLSAAETQVLNEYLVHEKWVKNMPRMLKGGYLSTSRIESFHSVCNKYCPKGVRYTFFSYCFRKQLAKLHWNAIQAETGRKWRICLVQRWIETLKNVWYVKMIVNESKSLILNVPLFASFWLFLYTFFLALFTSKKKNGLAGNRTRDLS